jgi:hypothetical protein
MCRFLSLNYKSLCSHLCEAVIQIQQKYEYEVIASSSQFLSSLCCFLSTHSHRVGYKDVIYFTLVRCITGYSNRSECHTRRRAHTHTHILVCGFIAMQNWMVSHHIFAVRTYFETKYIVHVQMHFQCEFHVLRHGRIPSHNAILQLVNDFNARGSAVHMLAGSTHSVRTLENVE